MNTLRRLSLLPALFVLSLAAYAQAPSPFEGKWVFSPADSIFSPGPLPQSETLTFTNGALTVEGVGPKGQKFLWSFTPVAGQPVLVTGRDHLTVETKETADTIVHMWSDASGTSYGEGHLSPDGKTLRYVLTGTRWGNHVYEVSVFNRADPTVATTAH
ncbi:hypothetical protein DYQ86_00965 [Acidobacteria bacterium AB60]|nr:hypothetical protein DYQ86_00965 [Acidobacteria bacterium AB60]